MVHRLRTRQDGFTLIELLVVVAIIGILVSMLIPNLLDGLQKAKQKRTLGDMRIVGTSMFAWLTDQVGASAAGANATQVDLASYGPQITATNLSTVLIPMYIQEVPIKDGWKNPYDYYLHLADIHSLNVMCIRSRGRDNAPDSSTYTVTSFEPTDYDRDIVWADGFLVRWPQR
ncbi:MAG TPA: type II secretion system protein [Thermoanaerobaculia bacterium]|nr:type II secretion system protein [Thermoanaerobaculia bacterium]